MTTETMTITRALAEVKHIKAKFDRMLSTSRFVAVAQGQETSKHLTAEVGLLSVDTFSAAAVSAFQSCEDQIKRYNAIRKHLILANATTTVTIGSQTMTIAEAIERKSSIVMEQKLLNSMKSQYANAQNAYDQLNTRLLDTIERSILQLYGNDRSKVTEEQSKVVSDAKRREFEPSVVDPLKLSDRIGALASRIEDFNNEINYSLSEVNASTKITVEY